MPDPVDPQNAVPQGVLVRYYGAVYFIPFSTNWVKIDTATENAKKLHRRTYNSPFLEGLSFAAAYDTDNPDAIDIIGPNTQNVVDI